MSDPLTIKQSLTFIRYFCEKKMKKKKKKEEEVLRCEDL